VSRTRSAGRARSASLGARARPSSASGAGVPKSRRVGVLLPGGLFGSMPSPDPEPFTVLAQSACEVLWVSKAELLKLPNKLVNSIYDYLVQATLWRLNRTIEGRTIMPTLALSAQPKSDGSLVGELSLIPHAALESLQFAKTYPQLVPEGPPLSPPWGQSSKPQRKRSKSSMGKEPEGMSMSMSALPRATAVTTFSQKFSGGFDSRTRQSVTGTKLMATATRPGSAPVSPVMRRRFIPPHSPAAAFRATGM